MWIRDLGFASWLLVGFVLIIVGAIWLLGQTSTIVMPVILASVLGAVAGPAVGWLEHHGVPRIGGAILVVLARRPRRGQRAASHGRREEGPA